MSKKTRWLLKFFAILLVLVAIGMNLQFIMIPAISLYQFWLVVLGFVLLLIASK